MIKNQKGNTVVLVVVMAAILAIIGIGFWAILSSKKQSSDVLKERAIIHSDSKQDEASQ